MKTVSITEAAAMLLTHDHIIILMHKSPDGDAIGCAYALCYALRKLGKSAQVRCSDPVPEKYGYLTKEVPDQHFTPAYIVSADLAAEQLFGDALQEYTDRVDLCIDHHGSNSGFARYGIIDPSAGACTQIVLRVIEAMEVPIDRYLANAIFTGLSTDTGCFKFSNASSETFRIAAEMIDKGAESAMINRIMFDTKSRARLEIERMALDSVRFYADGQIATVSVTQQMLRQSGADESETEGIASIPRQIEGVRIGITIKEKEDGTFRISMRTTDDVDASAVCAVFGGGGHKAAAGCSVSGTAEEVTRQLVAVSEKFLGESI